MHEALLQTTHPVCSAMTQPTSPQSNPARPPQPCASASPAPASSPPPWPAIVSCSLGGMHPGMPFARILPDLPFASGRPDRLEQGFLACRSALAAVAGDIGVGDAELGLARGDSGGERTVRHAAQAAVWIS